MFQGEMSRSDVTEWREERNVGWMSKKVFSEMDGVWMLPEGRVRESKGRNI